MTNKTERSYTQQFHSIFSCLCSSRGCANVWDDFILMSACSISNATDKSNFDQREEMYMRVCKQYTSDELTKITELFALTTLALEENPEQDFLGEIYAHLGFCNIRKGQVFTPYDIAKLMALTTCDNLVQQINETGFASINDPACGAGVMLIAVANVARQQGINYQDSIVFVAQDIDFTAAMMCYIQLALLGCVGYVSIGNTLSPDLPTPESIWHLPLNIFHRKLLEDFYHSQ